MYTTLVYAISSSILLRIESVEIRLAQIRVIITLPLRPLHTLRILPIFKKDNFSNKTRSYFKIVSHMCILSNFMNLE